MKSTILFGMTPFSGFAPNPVIHLVLSYKGHIPNTPLGQSFYPHFRVIILGNPIQHMGERAFEVCPPISKKWNISVDEWLMS
jgi:hypothetical protein